MLCDFSRSSAGDAGVALDGANVWYHYISNGGFAVQGTVPMKQGQVLTAIGGQASDIKIIVYGLK